MEKDIYLNLLYFLSNQFLTCLVGICGWQREAWWVGKWPFRVKSNEAAWVLGSFFIEVTTTGHRCHLEVLRRGNSAPLGLPQTCLPQVEFQRNNI
jgi:hypothetical protein